MKPIRTKLDEPGEIYKDELSGNTASKRGGRLLNDASSLRNLDSEELSRLALLAKISSMLNSTSQCEEVLQRIMESVIEVTKAERAFVLLREDPVGERIFRASGVDDVGYSQKIVDTVLSTGEALVSLDVHADRALEGSQSLQILGTRSVMCVPMRAGGKQVGLIYMDNNVQTDVFTESDRDLMQIIADMSAAALEQARVFTMMVQNEKMATLGTAIGGIAHELNSPLTALMLVGERLREEIPDSDIVGLFDQEMKRCRDLSRSLLRIVREEQTPRHPVSLPKVIENGLKLVRSDFVRSNIELNHSFQDDLPPILACPEQIDQIMVILLNNARQALAAQDKPGQVDVEIFKLKSFLIIKVSDNGPGIPDKHLERVFDPFFTTKASGEGTGLGLSLCRRLIKEHDGEMTAQNRPDGGAVFTIVLPALDPATPINEAPVLATKVQALEEQNASRPRILYAEDEDNIRNLLVRYFSHHGYEVDAFANGQEAFDHFRLAPEKYDLVILDMLMPVLGGKEAFKLIRGVRPEVAVLISSGSVEGGTDSFFKEAEKIHFLPKPYRPTEILEVVQGIITSNRV